MFNNITDIRKEDLGINYDGDKIDIKDILNKVIVIKGMEIRPSNFYDGEYEIIQIEVDSKDAIVITGSKVLKDQITKLMNKLPFRCKIIRTKRYYSITAIE